MKKSVLVILLLFLIGGIFVACNTVKNDAMETLTSNNGLVTEVKEPGKSDSFEEDKNAKNNQTTPYNTDSAATDNYDATIKNGTKSDKANDEEAKNEIFTVTFKDYDGKVLKTEEVKKGTNAIAPEEPARKGYRFVKWDTDYENVKVDIVTTAVYEEIIEPTFIVDRVEITSEKEVCVAVSSLNNPGLLGLMLNIVYDDSVLKLIKAENGSTMSDYMFTPPKNMQSGCNAAWSINDVPENVGNGEVLLLHFKVLRKAEKGTYPISISCNDGAFDAEYNSVAFDIINGSIIIK